MRIAVVGAGAWGTALAASCARAGRAVRLHGRDADLVAAIRVERRNPRYLKDIDLPPIAATTDMAEALDGAETVLLVVPVAATAEVGAAVVRVVGPDVPIVCCSKGIDPIHDETPSRIVHRLSPRTPLAALSGPSFAHDVARGLPTAVTLGAETLDTAMKLATTLSGPSLRLYAHDDLRGVELGGALKNVMAIAVGAARGLELGASAEAAVVARGFDELVRVAVALGARRDTLNGLSGLGDLVLSCSSEQSRNFAYGMALGREEPLEGLKLAEGVRTAGTAARIARERDLDCALIDGVDRMLNGQINASALVQELLNRPIKAEARSND